MICEYPDCGKPTDGGPWCSDSHSTVNTGLQSAADWEIIMREKQSEEADRVRKAFSPPPYVYDPKCACEACRKHGAK